MKKFGQLLTTAIVLCTLSSSVLAHDCAPKKVETYAHPGMFGSQAQELTTADSTYVTGGKILKTHNRLGIANKENAYVDSWVKDMMGLLKSKEGKGFNAKMPVLRSELAVILSEGFNLKDTKVRKTYNDIHQNYWAEDWITGALNAGVMIGYPDKKFRPDQPVTKAEVFATLAQLMNVPTDRSLIVPEFNNKEIKYIPKWAIAPTKEVVKSNVMEDIPNPDRVNNDEYLSKEQVAYLVGSMKQHWNEINGKAGLLKNYCPTAFNIKLTDRLSARQSNIGDKFRAKTTQSVTLDGYTFPAGSLVRGEVVGVERPGIKKPGSIKVKFTEIKSDSVCKKFPEKLTQAQATTMKNPNVIARLLGFPFSGTARICGVAGRTVGSGVNVIADGTEQFVDNVSNVFVDLASLQPASSARNVGNAAVTFGKGVFDICKLVVTGTFGVVYELTDEIRYLIVPQYSNSSSLNPGEELTIMF